MKHYQRAKNKKSRKQTYLHGLMREHADSASQHAKRSEHLLKEAQQQLRENNCDDALISAIMGYQAAIKASVEASWAAGHPISVSPLRDKADKLADTAPILIVRAARCSSFQ